MAALPAILCFRARPGVLRGANVFTGLVEALGRVDRVEQEGSGRRFTLLWPGLTAPLALGESVAVNGCCLTVEKISARGPDKLLRFSLLAESWKRTNFQFAARGSGVNLERALRVGDRLGGHFVAGHIDGLGKIIRWEKAGKDYVM